MHSQLDVRNSITNLRFTFAKMAAVVDYLLDSLLNFILFAIDSPIRATITILLISSLVFSNAWGDWIANLQQPPPVDFTGINDAIQRPNGGDNARPDRSRAESSSTRSSLSDRPQGEHRRPIGSQFSPSNSSNASNTNGNLVVRPPPRNRSNVSFYPSTNPGNRGKSVLPHLWLILGA